MWGGRVWWRDVCTRVCTRCLYTICRGGLSAQHHSMVSIGYRTSQVGIPVGVHDSSSGSLAQAGPSSHLKCWYVGEILAGRQLQ